MQEMGNDLYIAFRQSYELMHSASVPTREQYAPQQSEYPWWSAFVVLLIFISASVLSGVHTIPTVYDAISVGVIITETVRQVASVLSFIAVELAVFMSAYMLGKEKKMAWGVLVVGFSVAMISNLTSVGKAIGTADLGGLAVSVILGFGMPLLSLFTGKLYVNINRSERYVIAKAAHDYQAAREAFDLSVLQAYNDYIKANGRKKTRPQVSVSVSEQTQIGQPNGQSNGRLLSAGVSDEGKKDKWTRVEEYFQAHPDAMQLGVRKVAAELGVGHDLVSKVRQAITAAKSSDE